jgi:hypothetical protein
VVFGASPVNEADTATSLLPEPAADTVEIDPNDVDVPYSNV